MIEALAHDFGKATPQRFGNHANASAELLREAGFGDEGVLKLVRRHHHQIKIKIKTQISQIYTERDLELLQLADRLASQRRSEGGTSKSFTMDEMTNQHLKLTGAYLRFELKRHFQRCNNHHSHRLTQMEEYEAFKRFVQNNWWLEMVRASTTDATNKSLRHHLLLTDTIYQELLLEEAPIAAQINTDAILEKTISKIEGRPKDINLRLKIMDLLAAGEQLHPYGVWKELDVGGIHRDRRFISRLLEEMEMVGILEKGDGKYTLKNGFATKQMASKTQRNTPRNAKAKGIINEMHLLGYETDAIALEVGLPQSEVEAVLAITG